MTSERRSRRRFLRHGLAVAAAGVAGCSSLGPAGGVGETATIRETSVSGASLVVDLKEDHDVTKLNLVGPSGSLFRSTSVATGTNSAEIQLFDYSRGWQYSPGEHSLVAVNDEDEEITSTTVPLEPEIEITDVEQYTSGRPTPSNRGNLLVTVENKGTGPTWVYYVGYENALHPPANRIPTNDYAKTSPLLNLDRPESKSETILEPDDTTQLLGTNSPLLLSSEDDCTDLSVDLTVIVASGVGKNGQKDIQVTLSGEPIRANFRGTCDEIEISDGTSKMTYV